MSRCSAPWYELNINAADNYASACCYYAGETDDWVNDVSIEHYWNGLAMQKIRKINSKNAGVEQNGCSNCFYYNNYNLSDTATYYDFSNPPAGMSDAQASNWENAKTAYFSEQTEVSFTPLRFYANFGYTCNYSCGFCHQVPRRQTWQRKITSDTMYAWSDALERALSMAVIGGEPFAMPEAIKFIRRFVTDDRMKAVMLEVFTNGSVLHKHIDTLKQKDKVSIAVSLDGIGEDYEKWRVGGSWERTEKNLLMVRNVIANEKPSWIMSTNSTISKRCIYNIERFAEWHAENDIWTFFFDFINYRGTEDIYYSENIIKNPWLLDDVPRWEQKIENAIKIFEQAGIHGASSSLQDQYDCIRKASDENAQNVVRIAKLDKGSLYRDVLSCLDNSGIKQNFFYEKTKGAEDSFLDVDTTPMKFTECRADDVLKSDWFDIEGQENSMVRLDASWSNLVKTNDRHTFITVVFSDGTRADAIRKWHEKDGEVHMSMLAPTDNKKKMRILIKPTGEFVSYTPNSLRVKITESVNLDNLQAAQ